MFIKKVSPNKDKAYYYLVKSYRSQGKVKHKNLARLDQLDFQDLKDLKYSIDSIMREQFPHEYLIYMDQVEQPSNIKIESKPVETKSFPKNTSFIKKVWMWIKSLFS